MAEGTKIGWTDNSHNEWIGCVHDDIDCVACYAERDMTRRPIFADTWGAHNRRHLTREHNRNNPYRWNKKAEAAGKVTLVFTASLADVFEDYKGPDPAEGLDPWRAALFEKMEATPWLVWQVLTKRPQNVMGMVPNHWKSNWPENVWLGFSAGDQKTFAKRYQYMWDIPTPVPWLSAEPLFGHMDLAHSLSIKSLAWIVVGGESGPTARPMHPRWAQDIRDDCLKHNVPYFFKQWGAWFPAGQKGSGSGMMPERTEYRVLDGVQFAKVGKKNAGDWLDDEQWTQFPKALETYNKKMVTTIESQSSFDFD